MHKSSLILAGFAALPLTFNPAFALDKTTTQDDIRAGYQIHAATAQFHRWFLIYEKPEYGMANQLDILDEKVVVRLTLGVANGHDEYKARVESLPTNWQNAHELQKLDVMIADDGTMSLNADILYSNLGRMDNNGVLAADLSYTTKLTMTDATLPKFTEIAIAQNETVTLAADKTEYTSAYAENRLRSLAHYWLALVEDPRRDPEPFRELLADEFSLNFSSGAITNFEDFRAWVAGPASQVSASTHEIENFSFEEISEGHYTLSMDFDWLGILPNGAELAAKTRHSWKVKDNPALRFAEIEQMDVEVLEPFAPRVK